MDTLSSRRVRAPDVAERSLWAGVRYAFAIVYGLGALVHMGFAIWRPGIYRDFAAGSEFGWVRDSWQDVFMADPRAWALALAAGEVLIAILLIAQPRLGYVAVLAFTATLVLFGWGVLLWSVPIAAVVVMAMAREEKAR
jgi:hypothetical protein